jgi:DNA-binding NarL/FixJ family response regulator
MLMVITKIKRLAAAREKVAQLALAVEAELPHELAELHARYGFADVKSFLKAIRSAARGGGLKRARKAGRPKKVAAAPKTRKRAVITDAIRARVKKLVRAGKSGSQIAKAVRISLSSVQNIKKAGLVKSRRSKAKKAPAKKRAAKKRPVRKAPAKQAPAAPQPPAPTAATGE